jgi:hypothetical protein
VNVYGEGGEGWQSDVELVVVYAAADEEAWRAAAEVSEIPAAPSGPRDLHHYEVEDDGTLRRLDRPPWWRRVFTRAAVAVAVLAVEAALAAAPAGAHRAPRTPLAIALGKAVQMWGVKPCGGHYRVTLAARPNGEVIAGHARWASPVDFSYTDPPLTGCVMELRASEWSAANVEVNWPQLCTVVLHEWGHLLGHTHSDEGFPNAPGMTREQLDVMRSGKGDYASDVKRCGTQP